MVLLNGNDYPERETLFKKFNETIKENIKCGKVVISAGITDYNPDEDFAFRIVFERADRLMYDRKVELKAMGARTRE